MAGVLAAEGTVICAREARSILEKQFSPAYAEDCLAVRRRYGVPEDAARELLADPGLFGASAACAAGDGGVMAALWDFFEPFRMGFRVNLRDFLIAQETVEVCEILHLNPYRLRADGAMFFSAPNGGRLTGKLLERGIPARVIGVTEKSVGRKIENGEVHTFLDRPRPDELFKLKERVENTGKMPGQDSCLAERR